MNIARRPLASFKSLNGGDNSPATLRNRRKCWEQLERYSFIGWQLAAHPTLVPVRTIQEHIMSDKDGGHAFPIHPSFTPSGDPIAFAEFGMTLRDWFAGQSLAAITNGSHGWVGSKDAGTLAERAYDIADAMITQRSKP